MSTPLCPLCAYLLVCVRACVASQVLGYLLDAWLLQVTCLLNAWLLRVFCLPNARFAAVTSSASIL